MSENPYDTLPYLTYPRYQTHPDRLAAVATLFGMQPAPVRRCRVLEIGCGDGGNLIPMAWHLPGSTFVGVDLAEHAVRIARRDIAGLGLSNIEFHAADLRAIDSSFGTFDYIVAHGLYSWVPAEIREAVLAITGARLAPQGVAFISYNAMPGRHIRQMLREMMRHHTREIQDPHERVEQARWFLEWLGKTRTVGAAWRAVLDQEIAHLLENRRDSLAHDDLNDCNDSFYLHEFAAAASPHGLQYLGDAGNQMFDIRGALAWLEGNAAERTQYLDFIHLRSFAETLLCRSEVALDRSPGPEIFERMSFSSPVKRVDNQIEGLNGIRLTAGQPAVEPIALALGDSWPLPLGFADLLPLAGDRDQLLQILAGMVFTTFAQYHVHDFACARVPSERPTASRLARYQARDAAGAVASVRHAMVDLDEPGRRLLLLLDGTRTVGDLAAELSRHPGAPSRDELLRVLPNSLAFMAKLGLLEK